jgi:hypothetical protein
MSEVNTKTNSAFIETVYFVNATEADQADPSLSDSLMKSNRTQQSRYSPNNPRNSLPRASEIPVSQIGSFSSNCPTPANLN